MHPPTYRMDCSVHYLLYDIKPVLLGTNWKDVGTREEAVRHSIEAGPRRASLETGPQAIHWNAGPRSQRMDGVALGNGGLGKRILLWLDNSPAALLARP